MPTGTGNIGARDGCGVQRCSIEPCVGRRAGCGSDRRRRRCIGPEPGTAQCAALVLPQRLHGALLVGADRRRSGAQLFETAHVGALGRMPERRERDQSGRADCHRRSKCAGKRTCRSSAPRRRRSSKPRPPAPPPAATPAATARKPGPAQRQAEAATIRRACSADYRVHCAGIAPGGSASIACLKRNARTLSRGCLQALVSAPTVAAAHVAVPAAAAAPAPVAAPPPMEPAPLLVTPREERFIIRSACGADFATYCGGLRPGLGRVAACLHYNRNNLSPRCQQALIALHEGR